MNALERLIGNLARLPGLGKKSASRIVYYLLRADETLVRALAEDLGRLRQTIRPCGVCGNYTDVDPCGICTDSHRDRSSICVVEEPRDVLTIESIHEHRGLYHVLMGAISPIDGVGPDNLRIDGLVDRVRQGGVQEVILATNPNVEGDATAIYLAKLLRPLGLTVTRIARGLPVGGDLEYADEVTLARALEGRKEM